MSDRLIAKQRAEKINAMRAAQKAKREAYYESECARFALSLPPYPIDIPHDVWHTVKPGQLVMVSTINTPNGDPT